MTNHDDDLMSLDDAVRRMVLRQPPTPPAPCEDAPTLNGDDVVDPDEGSHDAE